MLTLIWRNLQTICWKFTEYLEKSERQYFLFSTKLEVCCFWRFCIDLLCDSICQPSIFLILWFERQQRKMPTILLVQATHIAEIFLAECASITPCNIKELSLTPCSTEIYWVFFQCKLKGAIFWVYNKMIYVIALDRIYIIYLYLFGIQCWKLSEMANTSYFWSFYWIIKA